MIKTNNIRFRILLSLSFFENIIAGWLCVWWMSIFSPLLKAETFSYRNMLNTSLSILFMSLMIYLKKEIPKFYMILIPIIISYLGLFSLMINYDIFILVSVSTGAIVMTVTTLFKNSLLAQNILYHERNLFDNRAHIINSIGFIIGSALALFTLFEGYPAWVIWLFVYIFSDLTIFAAWFCIKRGYLEYNLNFNKDKDLIS